MNPVALALVPIVAAVTYALLPSPSVAAVLFGTSLALGFATRGTGCACGFAGVQLGSLTYLVAAAAMASGAAETSWAATVLATACVACLVFAGLRVKASSPDP